MQKTFEKYTLEKRIKTMLSVDLRRAFTTPLYYLLVGISLVIPILILVMTTMVQSAPPTDQTLSQPAMESFTNAWQILGTVSGNGQTNSSAMSMDLVSMCNINMMYFMIAVFVCVFVADDFRSGYAKNLFTVRAKKSDYVISKSTVCFFGGASMILAFAVGSIIGGKIAGLSFKMVGFNIFNLVCCILSKALLSSIFVAIFLTMSVIAKQRLWLSMILSFGVGMFLFNIAPMVSPLNSTLINVILSFVGGVGFLAGLGAISNIILNKTALI